MPPGASGHTKPMHNFPNRTQFGGDEIRRIYQELMYQGCVWGGPSGSPSASGERCGHAEQFGSQAGWLQTIEKTD